tara:strand:+ start:310 stop:447 length:138 start_codon:yes stop_codon:yes gene_type:complete
MENNIGKRLYPKQTKKVILAKEFLKLVKEKKIIILKATEKNKVYE